LIQELAHERRAGGVRGVVPVGRAQRRIDDELHRARRQVVVGVEDPTLLAELAEGRPHRRVRGCKRRERAEHPPEARGE
jgi:hypothetical protein